MVERSLENLPLRELFTDAVRLTREMIDHLEHNLVPKANDLSGLVEMDGDETDIKEVTIRNHTSRLLESEKFTRQLYKKMNAYYEQIDRSVAKITGED